MSDLLSPRALHDLLVANFSRGELHWLPRPSNLFPSESIANGWNAKFAGKPALTAVQTKRYYAGRIHNRLYLAHRVIWAMAYGEWPVEIDHINLDGFDNRIENLRECSHRENTRNTWRKKKTSGFLGVSWCGSKNRWSANIQPDGRKVFLGRFDSEVEAARAYDAAAAQHFGEFARLNFPHEGTPA